MFGLNLVEWMLALVAMAAASATASTFLAYYSIAALWTGRRRTAVVALVFALVLFSVAFGIAVALTIPFREAGSTLSTVRSNLA